ncbi:hypothetical protein M0805_009563 [Coniferiporia weirii]|nr:hypothetical protein M0805_009563 [Coniferiporia weirii]
MAVSRTACSTPDLGSELGFDLGTHFPPPRPSVPLKAGSTSVNPLHAPRSFWVADNPEISTQDLAGDTYPSPPRSSESEFPPSSTAHHVHTEHMPLSPVSKSPRSIHTQTPRNLESGVRRFAEPRPRSGLPGAISALVERVRRVGAGEPELVPIQQRPVSAMTMEAAATSSRMSPNAHTMDVDVNIAPWSPLHVEKRAHAYERACRCARRDPKRRKRRLFCAVLLVIVILYLLANMIFLNIRTLTSSTANPGGSASGQSGGSVFTLSVAQETCLAQFIVNAPVNASAYPCATCLAFLQTIPSDFTFSPGSSFSTETLHDNIQFCGLQSLFVESGASAQSALANSGWVQNVNFCTWGGVGCNGDGLVDTLELTFPAVPSVIPSGIGALTSLETLQIIGGGATPAGSLPDSFTNLTVLTTLHLESTGLSALPSTLFASLSSITTLVLVKNAAFGGSLPDVSALELGSLVINEQALSTSLDDLLNSSTLQSSVKTLSITSAALNSTIPASVSLFSVLTELHLDGDNLQAPLPPVFPSSLQILTLSSNPELNGAFPESLCSSSALTTCTLTGTGFANASSCGVCTF